MEEAKELESCNETPFLIKRSEIINQRKLESRKHLPKKERNKFKKNTLVDHKKKDLSYTPYGEKNPVPVYLTDNEDDYQYVYEPSTCSFKNSLKWNGMPWFYQRYYIARVHNLAKMLGVRNINGQLDKQKDVERYMRYEKYIEYHKKCRQKIARELIAEKRLDRQGKPVCASVFQEVVLANIDDHLLDRQRISAGEWKPRLVKEAFRIWWNRTGRHIFSDDIWIEEKYFGLNLHQHVEKKQEIAKRAFKWKQERDAERLAADKAVINKAIQDGTKIFK